MMPQPKREEIKQMIISVPDTSMLPLNKKGKGAKKKINGMIGAKLEVTNLTKNVERIFEMSGILKLIPVTEGVQF